MIMRKQLLWSAAMALDAPVANGAVVMRSGVARVLMVAALSALHLCAERPAFAQGGGPRQCRLEAALERPFGSVPGEEIGAVADAVIVADSILVIGDELNHNVRFVSRAGQLLRTVGRKGNGPGEFNVISKLQILGDTVIVIDNRYRRVSALTLTAGFAGSSPMDAPGQGNNTTRSLIAGSGVVGVLPHGARLLTTKIATITRSTKSPHMYHDTVEVTLVRRQGRRRLAVLPEVVRIVSDRGVFSVMLAPFSMPPTIEVAGPQIVLGDGSSLKRFSLNGEFLGRITLPWKAQKITRDASAAWTEERLERTKERNRPLIRRMIEAAEVPSEMPIYGSVAPTESGIVWVQEYRPSYDAGSSRLAAFNDRGEQIGSALLRPGATLIAASRNVLAAVMKDEFDVQSVALYRAACR